MNRWIEQTKFYDGTPGSGNCTEAAVASILGLPLDQVPTFYTGEPGSQYQGMEQFFDDRGYYMLRLAGNYRPDCMFLAAGPADRGCNHMVLMTGTHLLHDPHPSRSGLTSVSYVLVLVPIDPSAR